MLATAIIVFREVLEAALIIGIVLAATQGLLKRGTWVGIGIAAGIAGAGLVALFADVISSAFAGIGQEVFNAGILLFAVIMLGWHNVWMKRHGREMARHMRDVGQAIRSGSRSMTMLAIVIGLAVLREGSEVVLFVYGITVAQQDSARMMLAGGLLGLMSGAVAGLLMYRGLLRLSSKYLFTVTAWLITLLAAGMAAQAAGFLAQADLLPSLVQSMWDTSGILAQTSVPGRVLQTLIGYVDHPSGIQVLFYVVTLSGIVVLTRLYGGSPAPKTNAVNT
ncbi:iron permease [Sulfuricaulis limicola]|uniref:Iron permease n=1 Tax=Sulfuricaulis limicola TaxID=1620215 RepID=A0A1B4XCB5_9GAMM|nr:FTR1 family protein [Sulfuricaulis limicola]BAV32459.1 iron permease [Sulfuricaulis limicola]